MNRRSIILYDPKLKERARKLRNYSTKSERILWKYLKGKQMLGLDFHRQRPVDRFIIDFLCQELFLGIELDGYSHLFEEKAIYDFQREQRLKRLGAEVIRFWDDEIFDDLENVLRVIEHTVKERKVQLRIEC